MQVADILVRSLINKLELGLSLLVIYAVALSPGPPLHSSIYSVLHTTLDMVKVGQSQWDDIKILVHVGCLLLSISVCVYEGH